MPAASPTLRGVSQEVLGPIQDEASQLPPAPLSARDFVRAIGAGFADGIEGRPRDPGRFDPEYYFRGFDAGAQFAPRKARGQRCRSEGDVQPDAQLSKSHGDANPGEVSASAGNPVERACVTAGETAPDSSREQSRVA